MSQPISLMGQMVWTALRIPCSMLGYGGASSFLLGSLGGLAIAYLVNFTMIGHDRFVDIRRAWLTPAAPVPSMDRRSVATRDSQESSAIPTAAIIPEQEEQPSEEGTGTVVATEQENEGNATAARQPAVEGGEAIVAAEADDDFYEGMARWVTTLPPSPEVMDQLIVDHRSKGGQGLVEPPRGDLESSMEQSEQDRHSSFSNLGGERSVGVRWPEEYGGEYLD